MFLGLIANNSAKIQRLVRFQKIAKCVIITTLFNIVDIREYENVC